uniref:Fatty acid synthase subunit alpha n=1 Tax=Cochliobolus carbonum TaxID=5017 RepID=TOXH_COCCA|nr:RecName: Full=Fatty acid synthase subunit alpha; AltName: Full=TOX2 HC-toxin biosynthesis cluster protein TOXH; Includes: RecName: Full=3-oxoacyl-[acyl-carrier-protein] reductase; AltName: Full=Beta-ketoacyl reductase; Includes: RecName: Full=3-oxoacyl-[acyl-carrier-protein] synthase [Bipolaris zeicola]AGR67369.1 fatty acid synthase alpha subunit [Bipolaris zeicola]
MEMLTIDDRSHQFAYPVRWIETQHHILSELDSERVVEVGPANILTNMMKKTWEQQFANIDQALGIERKFFGPRDVFFPPNRENMDMLRAASKKTLPEAHPPPPIDSHQEPSTQTQATHRSAGVPVSLPQQIATNIPPAILEDVSLPVSTIVRSLVAMKLRKRSDDISEDQTINRLVGGRSTLMNEILGDLHAEFPGHVPERPDDIPIKDLGETMSIGHNGRLGKCTASLVNKMISSKMPGNWGQSSVRQFLQQKWGLAPMRQDAFLLLAVEKQPATRLSTPDSVDQFLVDIATEYFKKEGMSIPQATQQENSSQDSTARIVDVQGLRTAAVVDTAMVKDIIEVLKGYSNQQGNALEATMPHHTIDASHNASEPVDLWLTEHGDEYAAGIQPMFDGQKERLYDSYWNWIHQDITELVTLSRADDSDSYPGLVGLTMRILNKICDRSLDHLSYAITQAKISGSRNPIHIQTLQSVYESSLIFKAKNPIFLNRTGGDTTARYTGHDGLVSSLMKHVYDGFIPKDTLPLDIPVGKLTGQGFVISPTHTKMFATDVDRSRVLGLTFVGKNVLITGAGKNSIGLGILRHLLSGGARVIVTTSSYTSKTTRMYQELYAKHGSRGSILRLIPFNQGSWHDVQGLTEWIYKDESWDLDFIIPFAAVPERGRSLENLDSGSELAHRVMLTNLLRLLGGISRNKRSRGIVTRPATVLLPFSPNHGILGNDGLYSESKVSLEILLNKWASESWADFLSLMGVIIGWTRGTGLMAENDEIADAVEKLGAKTFSSDEMAGYIATLMGGTITTECQKEPLVVDLGGGLSRIQNLKGQLADARKALRESAELQRAVAEANLRQSISISGETSRKTSSSTTLHPRISLKLSWPQLPDYNQDISPLSDSLLDMLDLSRVVVITGFSELGPHGNSRTRWELERNGTLSPEGCAELAWMMGLIQHHSGISKDGSPFSGWMDSTTKELVEDFDILSRYESRVLKHTGIRKIEPDICDSGYDPERKESLQEIVLQRDLPAFESTAEVADDMMRKHGDRVAVTNGTSDGMRLVQLKAGAVIWVPRASRFNRTVAGQIPSGWSAKRYGISDEIIEQVDPVTLFSLVCTVEALLSSGITDPYEWYQHIHISELGNCIGSSMGGLSSLKKMHRDRYLDRPVKGDILQETFINTTAAWINMLLFSSAGPIKTPVGACATSLESLDTGRDLIVAKKAKIVLVGGVEDFVEDVSYEFGSMKATCDTEAEIRHGRSPDEMSRPMASSRAGFVEAQGCGIQVLTSAELALKMGLPIYGIVAYTNMSADKIGRSVPAAGRGVLTNAREPAHIRGPETTYNVLSRSLLNLTHRRQMLQERRSQISAFVTDSNRLLDEEIANLEQNSDFTQEDITRFRLQQLRFIHEEASRQEADAAFALGNEFWKSGSNQAVSPIRGSLAAWGLDVDDICVASLHGKTLQVEGDHSCIKACSVTSFGFGQKGSQAILIHPRYLFATISKTQYEEYIAKNSIRLKRASQTYSEGIINGDLVSKFIKEHQPYPAQDEEAWLLNPAMRLKNFS